MDSNKRSLSSSHEAGPGPSSKVLKPKENSNSDDVMKETLFKKVIGNDVIFGKLERMLRYVDLKSFRLVSKTCDAVVLRHKFIRKTKFIVCDRTISSNVIKDLTFKPKHLKIVQFLGVSLEELNPKPLPEEVFRKMNAIPEYRILKGGLPIWSVDEMEPVLKLCEDICTMEIHGQPGVDKPGEFLRVFPSAKDLLATAKSFESLKIFCPVTGNEELPHQGGQMDEPTIDVGQLTLEGPCGPIIRCVKGFENLDGIKIMISRGQQLDRDEDYMRRILDILIRNGSTLQCFDLDSFGEDQRTFAMLNMAEHTLPKLENLKISFTDLDTQSVLHFISSHFSQLIELSLRFKGNWTQEFPTPLLHFLARSNSSKLLALRLYHPAAAAWSYNSDDPLNEPRTPLNLNLNLRQLSTGLQEFVMDFGRKSGVGIRLQDLPSSVQKVYISPCHQVLSRLIPVMRNIHTLFKILPNLNHLELRGDRSYGRGDIVLTDLQAYMGKKVIRLENSRI